MITSLYPNSNIYCRVTLGLNSCLTLVYIVIFVVKINSIGYT